MFDDTYPYLTHYWKDITYGHIDISGTQTLDWVTLPHNQIYYIPAGAEDADIDLLREDCIKAAGGENILDGYYGVILFFNGSIAKWAGKGFSGNNTVWINYYPDSATNYMNLWLIAHEMGHAYGLPHSSGRYGSEYDSPWDVMSGAKGTKNFNSNTNIGDIPRYAGSIPRHTIAFYKQMLGAIDSNAQWNNAAIDASKGVLIHLSRLEESAEEGDYLIANVYSKDRSKHYTVEARDKIGYDSSIPAKAVIIHEIENGNRAYVVDPDNNGDLSDAGAQWQEGEIFKDDENNISVEIVSSTTTGYDVLITAPRIKPDKVTGITATDDLYNKVRIAWSPVAGAEYYQILRYESWSINSTHQTFTTSDDSTYYEDVPNDTSLYYYRVQACNSEGCSPLSKYLYAIGSRAPLNILHKSSSVQKDNYKYYNIDAFAGEQIIATLTNLSADLYLYIKEGSKPTLNSHRCESFYENADQKMCSITLNSNKTVYIGIYGAEDGNFTLDVGVSGKLKDTDGDGIINHLDIDDDNDGVEDIADIFPLNANETKDTDQDGIGDNADTDDDNDGISDIDELRYGLDPKNASDAQEDNDNDGISNIDEIKAGTDPNVSNGLPKTKVTIPLKKGFNFISLPMSGQVSTDNLSANIMRVVTFDGQQKEIEWRRSSAQNSLKILVPYRGYFVQTANDTNITYDGVPFSEADQVPKYIQGSWNCLGSLEITVDQIKDLFASDYDVHIIYIFDNGTYKAISRDEKVNEDLKNAGILLDRDIKSTDGILVK